MKSRAAYQREWKRKNPNKVREYNKRARAAHPEKYKAAFKKWYDAHGAEHARKYRAAHPGIQRERLYGLNHDDYMKMVSEQAGKCKICQRVSDLHVDHNHSTGTVRALLCGSCNRAIGLLQDNASLCRTAADYLEATYAP